MKRAKILNIEDAETAYNKLKILTMPVRIEILKLLESKGDMNLQQINSILNIKQIELFGHLRLLINYNYITKLRNGHEKVYSFNQVEIRNTLETIRMCNSI